VRVLLDTNVLIAAFVARGTCSELLEYCVRNHTLVTSKPLLRELAETLAGKFGYTGQETREVVSLLQNRLEVVEPALLNPPVCRDPDDDVVLGSALAGACDCIVTGDKDLLVLERFREIPILMPAEFWRHEKPGV
jgi:putative PIN family toxin of toxin-antitoxin system